MLYREVLLAFVVSALCFNTAEFKKVTYKYLGCYKDGRNRALNGFKSRNNIALRVETCVRKCRMLKYMYAGLQKSMSCYCGNRYDKYGKAREKACSFPCSGNSSEKCGGRWKNSVYSTGYVPSTKGYIGCYRDRWNRAMKGHKDLLNSKLTNEACIQKCKFLGYKFAGTEYKNECFCSNRYAKYGKAPERQCYMSCTGNHVEICGGRFRLSVYSTGTKPKRPKRPTKPRYIGCFEDKDKPDRAMNGYYHYDIKQLTHRECIETCKAKKFKYAGIEFGTECYCDNNYHKHGRAKKKACSIACGGNPKEKCGGRWRLSVYSTGWQNTTKVEAYEIPL